MKRLALVCVLALAAAVFADRGFNITHTLTATHTIDTTGDSARSVKVHLFTARDSFVYEDTIKFRADTSSQEVVAWVSPLQVRRLNIAADGAVPDTAINYLCSLRSGAGATGFVYDPSGNDDTTVALLIDNLVDSINNVAGMSDTIVAHDSVSYIKVISKFAMDNLPSDARWVLTVADSVQEGDSTFTTIAMVCDSMTAYINGGDSALNFVTAANSGDTVYTVTSDDLGLLFKVNPGDTAQDTAVIQANVISSSRVSDTVGILTVIGQDFTYDWLYGDIIIEPSGVTAQGYGLSDSAFLYLYATLEDRWNLIASDSLNGFPCTLHVAFNEKAGNDTLFKEQLQLVVTFVDTTTDTSMAPEHNVRLKLIGGD